MNYSAVPALNASLDGCMITVSDNRKTLSDLNRCKAIECPSTTLKVILVGGDAMSSKLWIGLLLCASLCVASSPAPAQQGGFGHIGPSTGEVVGILVGTAAVIGLVVYLVIPKQKTIEGCVESGEGGMRLTDDKDKRTYALVTDKISLQPGRRVSLKGKKSKDKSGTHQFGVRKLVKDQGTC